MVTTGRYQNASEVLREGLRLVERQVSEDKMRLVALREAVQVGMADIEADRFMSFDSPLALGQHLDFLASDILSQQ